MFNENIKRAEHVKFSMEAMNTSAFFSQIFIAFRLFASYRALKNVFLMLFCLLESQEKEHRANGDVKEIEEETNEPNSSSMQTAKTYLQYVLIKNEANFIDKLCRFLFPCCYLVFNLFYWPYFELASFGLHPPDK